MNNFVSTWETLFGVYTPVQVRFGSYPDYTYEYYTDWGYISRVIFFIIVTYCILKLLGGVLRRDRR